MIGWFGTVLVLAMLMRPSSSVQQTWPEATVFPQQLTESRGGAQKLESPFGLTRDFCSYLTAMYSLRRTIAFPELLPTVHTC